MSSFRRPLVEVRQEVLSGLFLHLSDTVHGGISNVEKQGCRLEVFPTGKVDEFLSPRSFVA